jgi:cell wall-associated NlpC family hydrolase
MTYRVPFTHSFAALVCAAGLAAGCASTGAVPQPFPGAGTARAPARPSIPPPDPTVPSDPAVPVPRGGTPDGYALSGTALSLRGAPYRNGGTSPTGFDCSGFVQYVFAQHGLAVPRETRVQFQLGTKVDRDEIEPGDLVFFSTVAPGASHVGISLGGDQFVHAPSERGVVRIDSLSHDYWRARFIGARRVS